MLVFEFVRLRIRTVTFEAERIDFLGAQQVLVLSSVRFMARLAAFLKCRLVRVFLFPLLCLIRMARQANFHAVCFRQSRLIAGVRIVAIGAIAHRTGMLHFGRFDLFHNFVVAGAANGFHVFLRQHNLAAFRWRMAHLAGFIGKGRVQECLHQFRPLRFVRIVAGDTIGFFEWLILMRFGQLRVLRVVTIEAQRRTRLFQVLREFPVAARTSFVSFVTGVATHVQRDMAAAFFGSVCADGVAAQTEVFFDFTRSRLQQLIFVFAAVRIMALEAVANGGLVHDAVDLGGILVIVTVETKCCDRRCDQLDAGDVLIDADFMATRASSGHGRVHTFPFCFISMTFQALRSVRILVERYRMNIRKRKGRRKESQTEYHQPAPESAICDSPHGERKTCHIEPQDLVQVSGVSTF